VIEFTINTTNIVSGEYRLNIIAESSRTPATANENISIEIVKQKEKSETTQIFGSLVSFIPILIMIIIAIIVIVAIIRYRPKDEKLFGDTMPRGIAPGVGTDISYKPPLDSITQPTWQPQTVGKDKVPAIGAPAGTQGLPQLPPRQIPTPEEPSVGYQPTTQVPTTEPTPVPSDAIPELEPIPDTVDVVPPDEGPQVMLPDDIPSDQPTGITESELDHLEELEPLPDIAMPEESIVDQEVIPPDTTRPSFGEPLKLESVEPPEDVTDADTEEGKPKKLPGDEENTN
jgi:hypothetical protein